MEEQNNRQVGVGMRRNYVNFLKKWYTFDNGKVELIDLEHVL